MTEPSTFPAKVRTTMQPAEEIEVDEREYRELKALGILAKDKAGTPVEKGD